MTITQRRDVDYAKLLRFLSEKERSALCSRDAASSDRGSIYERGKLDAYWDVREQLERGKFSLKPKARKK